MSLEPGTRRGFLIGLGALVAAPMIVRAGALMPVKVVDIYDTRVLFDYDVSHDNFFIRVDRSLTTMRRPSPAGWVQEMPMSIAKQAFGEGHPIFAARPSEGRQLGAWAEAPRGLFTNGFAWSPVYTSRYVEPLVVEGDDSRLFPVRI